MIAHPQHHPPDTQPLFTPFEARRLERALRVALMLRGLALTIFGAVLPAVMSTFGLDNARASLLPLVGGLGAATAALGIGPLADHWGPRRVMLLTAAMLLAAALIIGLAPAWAIFILGAFLINWGAGGMATAVSVLLTLAYRGRSGAAFNRNFLFVGVGSLISPLVAGAILATVGSWRWVFATLSAAFVILLITVARAPYPPPGPRADTSRPTDGQPWWRRRVLVLCALALVCYVGAEAAMTTWAARFLAAERGAPIALSATVVSAFWAGMIVGRYGFSRLLRPGNEKRLVGIAGAIGTGAVLGFIWIPGIPGPLLAVIIGGLAFGGMWPTIMSYAAARAEGSTGAASGLLIALGFLGALTVPALVGVLSMWTGLGAALGLVAVSMALSAVLFYLA
ncbi:MAG: MFS transporter [Chloroflexi bacterium]|nr:MFS transporter [Chloroflexota bacterium]